MTTGRFEIEVAAPFRLDLTVWTLRRRAHNAIDRFDGSTYRRALPANGRTVETAVRQVEGSRPGSSAVEVNVADAPAEADLQVVRGALVRVLGVEADIRGFYELAARDERLTSLAGRFRGMRPPRFPSVFEAVVNAIACQQLTLTVGIHLLNRLALRYGTPVPGREVDAVSFPYPEQLADADIADLRGLGFSRSKARAVRDLADRVAAGELDLEALDRSSDEAARSALLELTGVGRWSAEYTLLRGLGRLEVFPGDDVGARNNLSRRLGLAGPTGYVEMAALARSWWPFGGLVYMHLLLDALAEQGHVRPRS